MSEDLLSLFRRTGALLDGHFVLRSGLHSRQYFQCALLLQHTEIATKVCGWLADKLRKFRCSPALSALSTLHTRPYFQCALLLQHTEIATKVCGWLADKLRKFDCDTVISPALGGIIVGQEVGRSLGKRHIFFEQI